MLWLSHPRPGSVGAILQAKNAQKWQSYCRWAVEERKGREKKGSQKSQP